MDATRVQEIYDAHTANLVHALCLNDWHIQVRCDKLDDGVAGHYTAHYEYRQATIALDPGELDTEEAVLEALFHELVHIALTAYAMPHNLAQKLARTDDALTGVNEAFRNAGELAVRQWTYALEVGLGLSMKKIAAIGARRRAASRPTRPKRKRRKS